MHRTGARGMPFGRTSTAALFLALAFIIPAWGGTASAWQGAGDGTGAGVRFTGGPDLGHIRAPTYVPRSGDVPGMSVEADDDYPEDGARADTASGVTGGKVEPHLLARAGSLEPGSTTGVPGVYDVIVTVDDGAPHALTAGMVDALARDLRMAGYTVPSVLPGLGMVEVSGAAPDDLTAIAAMPGVSRVDERGIPVMYSDVATPAAKARESDVYSPDTAWELGFSGDGVSLCVMDTGIDDSHPTHAGKFLGGADMSKPEIFLLTPRDGTFNPDDTQGHGTTCAGIAAGTGAPDGKYQGTAPGAHLVDLRIGTAIGFAPGELAQSFYDASLQGEEWALEHRDDIWAPGGGSYTGIDILSLSWGIDVGYSSEGQDPYSLGLDRLMDADVICVVAAGNAGPTNDGFSGMGAASNVITVGATDDDDTIPREDDFIAEYSSRGPRADNGDSYPFDELKPDLAAPGTHINQCNFDRTGDGSGQGYGNRGSGTSYATPLVAGVVALMLEANPDMDPYLVKEILRVTSERRGDATMPELDPFWNKDFGWGMVDAYEAVIMSMETESPGLIDVELQCFITELEAKGSEAVVRGIAWARLGEVDKVEYSIDGGGWHSASKGSDGTWTNWTVRLDSQDIDTGNHTIRARAVASGGGAYSLHDTTWFVLGKPESKGLIGEGEQWAWVAGILVLFTGAALFLRVRSKRSKIA